MIPLEERVCSRKTAADGRFEVTSTTADRLRAAAPLRVQLAGEAEAASLTSMACSCNTLAGATHVHAFVVAPLLRQLTAGVTYRLALLDGGVLQFERDRGPDSPR